MANKRFSWTGPGGSDIPRSLWVCDTDAGKPATGLSVGDLLWCIDTATLYTATGATTVTPSAPSASYDAFAKTGDRIYIAGANDCIASFGVGHTQNILRALPWIARIGGSINRFAVDVTGAVANAVARVGIYANNSRTDPKPAALLWESGELNVASVGYVTAAVTGVTVNPGDLLWCAIVNGGANGAMRTLQSAEGGLQAVMPLLGFADVALGTNRGGIGYTIAHTYGALPNPYGAGTILEASSGVIIPFLGLRYA